MDSSDRYLGSSGHVPVIVGVGQYVDRIVDLADARDPVGLMTVAARAAFADAGLGDDKLASLDSVDVVNVLSWRYGPDAAHALSDRLGISPRQQEESPVGGEQPIALVDRLAARVAAGAVGFGLIAGAEAQASLNAFRRAGTPAPWPAKPERRASVTSTLQAIVHPEAWRHGLRAPIQVYPLFENAFRAFRGQSFTEAQTESATIWSNMSRAAEGNPYAWRRESKSPGEISTPGPRNPWIYYPYTRFMNASPAVNLAAAVLVTSREKAREWGIPEDRWVTPVAAAGAREVTDPFSREQFHRSPAMEATLDTVLSKAGDSIDDVALSELYSCFPCVPKMAAGHLGLKPDAPMTVIGGLTFFGGPGNDYMLHAVAAMVERLRRRPGSSALLYGQGEFVTKHHALVLRSGAAAGPYVPGGEPEVIQPDDAPPMATEPRGAGEIETFTAAWNPDGSPGRGIVVGRLTASGHRFVSRTREGDDRGFRLLTDGRVEPVGRLVQVEPQDEGNVVSFP